MTVILRGEGSCVYSCLCLTAVIPDGKTAGGCVRVGSVHTCVLLCAVSVCASVCEQLIDSTAFPFLWCTKLCLYVFVL